MKSIQLIGITPEQLTEAILQGVDKRFEQLKKEYSPKEPEEFLTRAEVAKLLKVDISSVHNYSVSGKLKRFGIGSRVLYRRSDIEESLIPLNK